MNKIKPNKTWIIYGIVFAAFMCIGIFAGLHHEAWADEAQSWLIARDNDLIGIFKAVKYEGTLPTWHLINKAFQLAGLDYDHIFVIPLIFSAIGVILLFLTDAPLLAKIMLPFSFFVVYQNSVVARQYSLVFPAMMLIVILYKKRFEVPVRYHLALFLLAITSSYGVVIACSFMLWDFIGMVRTRFNDPLYKKTIIPFFATGLIIVVMSYLSLPPDDCSMSLTQFPFAKNATNALLFNIDNVYIQYGFLAFVLLLLCYYFRHNLVRFLVIFAPLIIFMNIVYQREWHMTYLFFLIVSLMIIFYEDFKKSVKPFEKTGNRIAGGIVTVLLAVQCFTGFYSIFYDYRYDYSASKEIAEYLTPYVESGAEINRIGFDTISVSPYFDHSIYSNDTLGKTYYIWSYSVPNDQLTVEEPDVIVSIHALDKFENDAYGKHVFVSHMIFKFNELDSEKYYLYVKK